MIEGSSSSRLLHLLGVPVWREWCAWVRDPRPDVPRTPDVMSGLRVWQSLVLLDVTLMAVVIAVFLTIEAILGDLPNSSVLEQKDGSTVVAAVIIAPVLEELFFRGWLPGKRLQLLGLVCAIMLPVLLVLLRLLIGPLSGAQNLLVIIVWVVTSAVILAGVRTLGCPGRI